MLLLLLDFPVFFAGIQGLMVSNFGSDIIRNRFSLHRNQRHD